jgi:two-component system cell cycle response regulator
VKILIADDDVTSRLILTGVLRKHGHEVVATVDGTEAWEAMRRPDAPILAILDWMMPGLSGVEVCRLVRGLQSDQPPYLVILTSRGEKTDIVEGLEAGADDYLAKPFDPGELRARVDVGGRVIELQVRLREAYEAAAYEAQHDPLTGALNRRAFRDVLTRAVSEERHHHRGLAIGICDVDEFKKVNDAHGHQVGDEVLCGLVRIVTGALRASDVLSRVGGDEFVVVAEGLGAADAGALFERMRAAVAADPIATEAGNVRITISVGVASWRVDDTERLVFARADEALYRAKSDGRDRVRFTENRGPDPQGQDPSRQRPGAAAALEEPGD